MYVYNICTLQKVYMNGESFLPRVMSFFECGVHRTYGIGDIAFSICHEFTCDHLIKKSR